MTDAQTRWQKAADACRELFRYPGLSLYDVGDPYESYKDIHMKDWNCEVIVGASVGAILGAADGIVATLCFRLVGLGGHPGDGRCVLHPHGLSGS